MHFDRIVIKHKKRRSMLTNKLVDFLENILVKLIRHRNMLNILNLQ